MHDVFLPGHAKRTMYLAADNYLKINNPDFGLKEEVTSEDEAILRLKQEISLAFGPQGT